MLLPTLNKAREKAHASSCTNNLKQIINGWTLYTLDYDGRLDGVRYTDAKDDDINFWDWQINRYFGAKDYADRDDRFSIDAKIFLCPSDKIVRVEHSTAAKRRKSGPARSYAVTVLTPASSTPKKLIKYVHPSATIVHMEAQTVYSHFNKNLASRIYSSKDKYSGASAADLIQFVPHSKFSNFTFADGHVAAIIYHDPDANEFYNLWRNVK